MAEEAYDVVVVGSCNVDLISYIPRFPKAGETINGSRFAIGCGGKGANACVMAAKLGARTSMIGRVGDDSFGEMFLKSFLNYGIDVGHLHVSNGVTTGVAPIFVNDEGENAIVIVKGANDLLTKEDLKNAQKTIKKAKVVLCQLEINPVVTLEALKMAKAFGVTTIFNPAPAVEKLPNDFILNSDILICNETEAELLTGKSITSEEDRNEAIKSLLSKGCKQIVITLGSKGSIFATNKSPNPQFIPADQVHAVDTTGAGDAFVGTLAYFYASRKDELQFSEIVKRAGSVASVTVTKHGTQTSYPMKSELPEALFN